MSTPDVRAVAARVLEHTLASAAPVDVHLAAAEEQVAARDRPLLRALVLATLRWLRRIDAVLEAAATRRLEQIDPQLLAPLRVGVCQLLYLERVPAHAAVDTAVAEVRRRSHRAAAGFANAVLRRVARSPSLDAWPVRADDAVRRLAIETSHPDLLARRWVERLGMERAAALLRTNNVPRPLCLLAFADRGGRAALASALMQEGVATEPSSLSSLGLIVRDGDPLAGACFRRGDFYVQDEASQAAAWIPRPRPGERVLDVAAAPGGKTFALLAREPGAQVFAADVSPARVARLRENLARLGRRVPVHVADGLSPAVRGGFDRVTVDLPCTGTGTLRKHPELKWRISEAELVRLAAAGERLLEAAAGLVTPGGWLVAITCSLEPEENESVVAGFLERVPGYRLEEPEVEEPLQRGLEAVGRWRVFPAADHDGFTVHTLRRQI